MKKQKSNIFIKNILIFCVLFLISIVIELLGFNFKLLTLNNRYKGTHNINNYSEKIKNGKKNIEFNLKNQYVHKLIIKYNTKQDIATIFKYEFKNNYDKKDHKKFYDIFETESHIQVVNIDHKVGKYKIIMDKNDVISIKNIYINNNIKLNFFRTCFIFFLLIIIFVLIIYYRKGGKTKDIHKYFLIIGLIMGIGMIIIQPNSTFYSWDDQIHFRNSYQLFGNHFKWSLGELAMMDISIPNRNSIFSVEEQEEQIKYLSNKVQSNYTSDKGMFITYNQVAYIPSAIGYRFAKLLHLPFVICFKAGKFMNLLCYLLIMCYSIKIAKFGKRILSIIGLMPSTMFLACQYSYDPAVISGLALGMTMLFNWLGDEKFKINFTNILIFILAMIYACFTKAIYIPLILLFLFIPHNRFKTKMQETWLKFIVCLIFFLILYTFALPSDILSTTVGDLRGGATSVAGQFRLVLSHPLGYIQLLWQTAGLNFFDKLIGNMSLGSFSYMGQISSNIYVILMLLLFGVSITDNNNYGICIKNKIIICIINIVVIVLIWTSMYLAFTPVGLIDIHGVQNRYFIPLIYPFMLCLNSTNIQNKIEERKYNIFILAIISISFMITLYNLILTQYCL